MDLHDKLSKKERELEELAFQTGLEKTPEAVMLLALLVTLKSRLLILETPEDEERWRNDAAAILDQVDRFLSAAS